MGLVGSIILTCDKCDESTTVVQIATSSLLLSRLMKWYSPLLLWGLRKCSTCGIRLRLSYRESKINQPGMMFVGFAAPPKIELDGGKNEVNN